MFMSFLVLMLIYILLSIAAFATISTYYKAKSIAWLIDAIRIINKKLHIVFKFV